MSQENLIKICVEKRSKTPRWLHRFVEELLMPFLVENEYPIYRE